MRIIYEFDLERNQVVYVPMKSRRSAMIEAACIILGCSMNSLAYRLGIRRSHFFSWKSGMKELYPEQAQKLAALLGIEVDLINGRNL